MPTSPPLSVLWMGAADDEAAALLAGAGWPLTVSDKLADPADVSQHDAVVWPAADAAALDAVPRHPRLAAIARDKAVVVVVAPGRVADDADVAAADQALLAAGVEAIVDSPGDGPVAPLMQALRHAVGRKEIERRSRTAWATDLTTGLPHAAQLLEHLAQLLALREREPAPMVLLVLRLRGMAALADHVGPEWADVLRRKVAVRLRSGLRASDVVAALAPDAYAVLLVHVEAAADGERVAAKLVTALQQPFTVAGQPCTIAAAVGIAAYPEHGKDAATLLARAGAQADAQAAQGSRAAWASGPGGRPGGAANDAPG